MSDERRERDPETSGEHFSPLQLLDVFDIDFDLTGTRGELVKKIRWLIRIRYGVAGGVILLMFFTGWQGLTHHQTLTREAILATVLTGGIAGALNVIYLLALRRQHNLKAFVLLQLLVDVLIFSSYVYRSGGVTSPFTFLYLLPIIAAAMLVSGRASALVAGTATVVFATMVALEASGVIRHISYFVALDRFAHKWRYVTLILTITPVAFFTVAGLTAFLMRTVHRKTQELTKAYQGIDRKAALLEMLYRVSRSAVDEPDAEHVLDAIGDVLVKGLSLDRVLLYLVDDAGERLELKREFYHPRLEGKADRSKLQVEIPLREDAGVTARCALRREAENVRDPEKHTLINRELAQRIGINPFAVAPMVARGELLGVLGVDRSSALGVIDDEELRVLIAFADQAAGAIMTAHLEQERRKTVARGPRGEGESGG